MKLEENFDELSIAGRVKEYDYIILAPPIKENSKSRSK